MRRLSLANIWRLFDRGYRPERYYMRGPGPACAAKDPERGDAVRPAPAPSDREQAS